MLCGIGIAWAFVEYGIRLYGSGETMMRHEYLRDTYEVDTQGLHIPRSNRRIDEAEPRDEAPCPSPDS